MLARKSGELMTLVGCIRYRDAVIFAGPSLIGLLIFLPGVSLATVLRAIPLALGSVLLMAYIFAINDWADIGLDRKNAQKHQHTFLEKGIARHGILGLSVFLATASVLILTTLSWSHALIALTIVAFGFAYSLPIAGWQGKRIPVLSSCLHFVTIVSAFLLGSMTYSPIDARALLVGSYLAILITAGHLVQETQDYHDDLAATVRTNAVQFGQRPVFALALGLFGLSFLVLVGLAEAGLLPKAVEYSLALFPVFAIWAIRTYRTGPDRDSVSRFRSNYRRLFAVVVIVLLVAVFVDQGLPLGGGRCLAVEDEIAQVL